MERFSPVGKKVSVYWKRTTPQIADWSKAAITKMEEALRILGLFVGEEVDMVDALGKINVGTNVDMLREKLDFFGTDITEVKGEMKRLRESVIKIRQYVETSQASKMEELKKMLSIIVEKSNIWTEYEMSVKGS